MNINQLRYFIAVADTLSFTKAAKKFYLSQTAITLQMKQLEADLDCELIDRSSRPLKLTQAGKTFLKEAKAIVERVDSAIIKTKQSSNGLEGVIRIGYIKGYERSEMISKISIFHEKYPNVLISVYRLASDELAKELLNDNLDAIITWDSTNIKYNDEIGFKKIEDAPLTVALYSSHQFANREYIKRQDLKNESIIYMTPSSTIDSYGDAHFIDLYHKAGFTPDIIFSSNDFESILLMVSSKQGVSIMPNYCTKKLENGEGLTFLPLVGEEEYEEIDILYKKDNPNIEIINRLLELFKTN